MRKLIVAAMTVAFAVAAAGAPAFAAKKKKAKAGMCGAYMFFDKKAKKCADARAKK
jgi:hypothetical protein